MHSALFVQPPDEQGFTRDGWGGIPIGTVEERPWTVGDVIRKLRVEAGWTLEPLARAIGSNVTVISRIELGKTREPKRATLQKIASAFGLTARDLEDMVPPGTVRFDSPSVPEARIPASKRKRSFRKDRRVG